MTPIFILLWTVGQVPAASPLNAQTVVERGLTSAIARHQERVEELRKELARAKRGLVLETKRDRARFELQKARADNRKRAGKKKAKKPRLSFDTREKKDERVAKLEGLLASTLAMPTFPFARGEPGPGDLGKIRSESFKVIQVAGPREVLGQISWHHGREMEIDGVLQDTPITTVRTTPFAVWLSDVDTSDMVAGKVCEVKEPIIILPGKKEFRNAQGGVQALATGRALRASERKRITDGIAAPIEN